MPYSIPVLTAPCHAEMRRHGAGTCGVWLHAADHVGSWKFVAPFAGVIFSVGALRHINKSGEAFETCTGAEPYRWNTGDEQCVIVIS